MRIWLVPALGALMVIAAIVASRVPPAAAAAPVPARVQPVEIPTPHYAEPPPPPAPSLTGIPECDRYVSAIDQLERCPEFPAAARDSMQQGREALVRNMRTQGEASRPTAVMACTQGIEAIHQAGASIHCAL